MAAGRSEPNSTSDDPPWSNEEDGGGFILIQFDLSFHPESTVSAENHSGGANPPYQKGINVTFSSSGSTVFG